MSNKAQTFRIVWESGLVPRPDQCTTSSWRWLSRASLPLCPPSTLCVPRTLCVPSTLCVSTTLCVPSTLCVSTTLCVHWRKSHWLGHVSFEVLWER